MIYLRKMLAFRVLYTMSTIINNKCRVLVIRTVTDAMLRQRADMFSVAGFGSVACVSLDRAIHC